jgi:hypothetical protein
MKESTKMFLEGDTSEKEFYKIKKDNLITARDYLCMLRQKERKFKYYAGEEIDIVKKIFKWVKDVQFDGIQEEKTGGYLYTNLNLITVENEVYGIVFNHETKQFEPIAKELPKLSYLFPKTRRFSSRMLELYRARPFLYNIENTGRVTYDKCLFQRKSISGNFIIDYKPEYSFFVNVECEPLVSIYSRDPKFQEKPYLKGYEAERVLGLIQLEEKNLPDLNVPSTAAIYIFEDYKKHKVLKNNKEN